MFSGIVESCQKIQKAHGEPSGLIRIFVERPREFEDLKLGDSIAVDGVCLTVEKLDPGLIQFALGAETLRVLERESVDLWEGRQVNLERSLRMGDRIHGHLVSGHVEGLGQLIEKWVDRGCLWLKISLPAEMAHLVWKKGSISIHGVSLTVNDVSEELFTVCLIPETLKRTNLDSIPVGAFFHLESDFLAKAALRTLELRQRST